MTKKTFDLDDKDRLIIDHLKNGTIVNSAIASELGVSEGMVRQRIKKMRDSGVLSLRGFVNPDVLDSYQLVILGATVTESKLLTSKADEIAALDSVISVSIVSGRFDLIIELLLSSHQGLITFLSEELSNVSGIAQTESFIALHTIDKFV